MVKTYYYIRGSCPLLFVKLTKNTISNKQITLNHKATFGRTLKKREDIQLTDCYELVSRFKWSMRTLLSRDTDEDIPKRYFTFLKGQCIFGM